MRILLSDGAGLTSRQVATQLHRLGHHCEALTPDRMCICRFTRHVSALHVVPRYGDDPLRWLEAALEVYEHGRFDLLLPTQEQVAVLSLEQRRIASLGVRTVVPEFAALARVQDKVQASRTLDAAGIPRPPAAVLERPEDLPAWSCYPAYLKLPVGTASDSVWRLDSPGQLNALHESGGLGTIAPETPVLLEAAVPGPVLMVQSIFEHGEMRALHANLRTAEGLNGGAAGKRSLEPPALRDQMTQLGRELEWHGALSADVVVGSEGLRWIDVNPRLIEPGNAWWSGVDLVTPLLELATIGHSEVQPPPAPGVATHQLLLAILGASERRHARRAIGAELIQRMVRRGIYASSVEELSPCLGDALAPVLPALAAAATLTFPRSRMWFAGSVRQYALSPEGWHQLLARAASSRTD